MPATACFPRQPQATLVLAYRAMAKIGELLIAGGLLTQDGLEEALDWQVLYGGRLGTNLLELKLVEEADFARALGKQLGAEVAWGDIVPDSSLINILPKHIADRAQLVPWKLERRRLKILCAEIKLAEMDQLGYKVGRPCVPVVAPEFRIHQLLRAHYQAQRQMRALDFGIVPEEGREERRKQKQKKGPVEEPAPELIDESAFNDIYNQVLAGRSAQAAPEKPHPRAPSDQTWSGGQVPQPSAAVPEQRRDVAPPASFAAPPAPQEPAQSWQQHAHPHAPPVMARAPARPETRPAASTQVRSRTAVRVTQLPDGAPMHDRRTSPPPQELESLPDDAILEELPLDAIEGEPVDAISAGPGDPQADEAEAGSDAELPLPEARWDELPPPEQVPVDESRLEFKQALKLLEGVTDRDSIARIVLRASRSKAARALLLQVQGGVALGWDGIGEGFEPGNVRSVAIPLGEQSAFQLVVKTRSHYMGPLQKTPLNIRFLATLGKKIPLSSLILPILHKGRVSYLLYLDNGHRQQAPTDVGEMLILSQRIAQTVEALVERKRKAARG